MYLFYCWQLTLDHALLQVLDLLSSTLFNPLVTIDNLRNCYIMRKSGSVISDQRVHPLLICILRWAVICENKLMPIVPVETQVLEGNTVI
jgi:hypothetical protein